MRKYLLSLTFLCTFLIAKSQTVLNEIYTDPGSGKSEFFELYNSSVDQPTVDCFTVVTYWTSGSNKGWYVMDLPNLPIGPKGFFVGAAAKTFNVQSASGMEAHFSWNDATFKNSATGSLKKWQLNGSTYQDVSSTIPNNFNDFLSGGNGQDYIVLVFVNGVISNGIIGGSGSNTLSSSIASLPNLPVSTNCGAFTINFSQIGAVETVISQPGSDNGYARGSDGKCGSWIKTSASVNHTPKFTNGNAVGLNGSLMTASETVTCNLPATGKAQLTYDITGVSGDVSEPADFPVQVMLYKDLGLLGVLDGADQFLAMETDQTVTDPAKTFTFDNTSAVILIYKTKRGCFDKLVVKPVGCAAPLPVTLKSFQAKRAMEKVLLTWETAMELNNQGFEVQRKVGNEEWKTIAFVSSQANGGNSNAVLIYEFADINPSKGASQYRLRQVDIDSRYTFTEVRSVRGQEQAANKLLIFPNPSTDGNINLVFEERNVNRNITVSDITGRVVKQYHNITAGSLQVEGLQNGIYILLIANTTTGETAAEKIIIKKR